MSSDARLSADADRTHRVYWGSHGCCLPYLHAGPCVCDCALVHVIVPWGALRPVVVIDTEGACWTPEPGQRVTGDDVYGPPEPGTDAAFTPTPGGWL